ncbi:hypothetical protein [Klenkia sp. PcliD-1-E]|uniref:hypothetical protein n=1 Tax=Klenkia sp. PcliD-1-E TaxID=2954492 RepID=UPI002096F24F|nr:hypothetical protein [Klenkia sp. PcliD-1-E]MCO7218284.1 hypothetical protein [Klenkia sp. PcliD-1-E]
MGDELSAVDFRALARSSPWLWSTVQLTYTARRGWDAEPVRAWVRRPGSLRVETLDGRLLQAGVLPPGSAVVLTAGGGEPARPTTTLPAPRRRDDGLVADRSVVDRFDTDAPFYRDYHWIACLDPVELADGDPERGPAGTTITDVHAVDHRGRPGWAATVVPAPAYEPRCACCPLLPSAVADRLEGIAPTAYADAHLVLLDRATGICVSTTELGGPRNGLGHVIGIEAVDDPLADELFAAGGRG